MTDFLHITFDKDVTGKDLAGLCIARRKDGEYRVLDILVGRDAERLYNMLTKGIDKAKWRYKAQPLTSMRSDMTVTCSLCGYTKSRADGEILHFCPNCGADMRENKDGRKNDVL